MSSVGDGVGYRVSDLQRFLTAADDRIRVIQEAITEARARHEAELGGATATTQEREALATAWLESQSEADAIRTAAEAQAQEIIDQAEKASRSATPGWEES